MKLRYIFFTVETSNGFDRAFASEFQFRTSFIRNFLSRQIRILKFETDGTFNAIGPSIVLQSPRACKVVPDRTLECEILFDPERYEAIKGTENCEYYLDLFETGFRKAAGCKDVPLADLLRLLMEFRAGGCRNEWRHKKRAFKDIDTEVALDVAFTTDYLALNVTFASISTKELLCSGPIIKTLPDEIFHNGAYKDIVYLDGNFVLTDIDDEPVLDIGLEDVSNGALKVKYRQDSDTANRLRESTLLHD